MKTITTWQHGMAFDSELEGHTIHIDGGRDKNDQRLGFGPKALLLSGLAGCSGIDVVEILHKMKVAFTQLRITTEADTVETDPKVFKDITITYATDVRPEDEVKLKRAIELSLDKYCGVSAMLKKNSAIHYRIETLVGNS
jgi:putative redox protein